LTILFCITYGSAALIYKNFGGLAIFQGIQHIPIAWLAGRKIHIYPSIGVVVFGRMG